MTTQDFIKALKDMKVTELNDLVKAIEEEFGVTAAAPMAGAGAGEAAAAVDQDLILVDAGASKINVIKLVREILGLGLMEAKAFVDTPGGTIKAGASADEIADLTAKFAEAGAKVDTK